MSWQQPLPFQQLLVSNLNYPLIWEQLCLPGARLRAWAIDKCTQPWEGERSSIFLPPRTTGSSYSVQPGSLLITSIHLLLFYSYPFFF